MWLQRSNYNGPAGADPFLHDFFQSLLLKIWTTSRKVNVAKLEASIHVVLHLAQKTFPKLVSTSEFPSFAKLGFARDSLTMEKKKRKIQGFGRQKSKFFLNLTGIFNVL